MSTAENDDESIKMIEANVDGIILMQFMRLISKTQQLLPAGRVTVYQGTGIDQPEGKEADQSIQSIQRDYKIDIFKKEIRLRCQILFG
jgi:hypothetical protein